MKFLRSTLSNLLTAIVVLETLVTECSSHETKYAYYDDEKKKIKASAEYVDGRVQGKLAEYYESGGIKNISYWENGQLNGVSEGYLQNGKLQSRSYYSRGALEKAENFDSVGRVTEINYYDLSGTIYNTLYLNPDSTVKGLKMLVNLQRKDEIYTNQKMQFDVRLVNVTDTTELSGVLRVGSDFNETFLADTLLAVKSMRNLYEFEIPARPGTQKIAIQLRVNTLECSGKEYESLFFFWNGECKCPENGLCTVTPLPLPEAFQTK